MEIPTDLVTQVLSVVFFVLTVYFKLYLDSAKRLFSEMTEAMAVTNRALEDNAISEEELKAIVKEWNDVLTIFKNIFNFRK